MLQLTEFRLHPIAAAGSREPDGPCNACIDARVGLVHVDEVGEAVALLELVHEAAAALKTAKEDSESPVKIEGRHRLLHLIDNFGISVVNVITIFNTV